MITLEDLGIDTRRPFSFSYYGKRLDQRGEGMQQHYIRQTIQDIADTFSRKVLCIHEFPQFIKNY